MSGLGAGNATSRELARKAADSGDIAPPRGQIAGGYVPKQRVFQPSEAPKATWDPASTSFHLAPVIPARSAARSEPRALASSASSQRLFYAPRHERQPTLPASQMRLALRERERMMERSSSSMQHSFSPSTSTLRASASEPVFPRPLSRSRTSMLGNVVLSTDGDASLSEQIVVALNKSKGRVSKLFTEWDESGDGKISKEELRLALLHLGLASEKDARVAADELFDAIDRDGSGTIEMAEFFKELRTTASRYAGKHRPAPDRAPPTLGPADSMASLPRFTQAAPPLPGITDTASSPGHSSPSKALAAAHSDDYKMLRSFGATSAFGKSSASLGAKASFRSLARSTSMLSLGTNAMLPPPKVLKSLRVRPPVVHPGVQPSVRRRPPSLANLRAAAQEDEAWFKKALDANILPAPAPSRIGMSESFIF